MTSRARSAIVPSPQAEEAEIQDNLGEFPDRFADRGEWRQTPLPRRSSSNRRSARQAATGSRGDARQSALPRLQVSGRLAATA